MKQATVKTVYDWINGIAPYETAEAFDNVGLLVGSMNRAVDRVLVALDATPDVVQEAVNLGAQLILTHHPLMFRGTKRIVQEDFEGGIITQLIKHDISLIAAHTNLDRSAQYSGSVVMANKLQLRNIRQEDFLFVGDLPDGPVSAKTLQTRISAIEGEYIHLYGDENTPISTIGICGGAFDEGFEQARSMGAQAYLTGEVRHHNAIAAAGSGFVLFGGGHYGTEAILIELLAKALQSELNALQYNVVVYPSVVHPYGSTSEL